MGSPYTVICISMFDSSLLELDAMVLALKQDGIRGANRSALIRLALRRLDLGAVTSAELATLKRSHHSSSDGGADGQ